jgi:hypothetical protein
VRFGETDTLIGSCVWREMEMVCEAEGVAGGLTVMEVSRWKRRPDNPCTEESSRCVSVKVKARD